MISLQHNEDSSLLSLPTLDSLLCFKPEDSSLLGLEIQEKVPEKVLPEEVPEKEKKKKKCQRKYQKKCQKKCQKSQT